MWRVAAPIPVGMPSDRLVVGDGVEVVVVAAVEHGVNHAAGDTKHGTTSVLDLAVEGAVTLLNILDLGGEGVSSGDGTRGSIVSTGEVLGASGVLTGGHGDDLSGKSEDEDLEYDADPADELLEVKARDTVDIAIEYSPDTAPVCHRRSGSFGFQAETRPWLSTSCVQLS